MTDRFERPGRVLAAGDLLVVVAVVAWGIVDHHGLAGLLDVRRVVEVVGPFALGFALVAAVAGIYADRRPATLAGALRSVAVVWLGAANLGLLMRGSPYLAGGTTWPFPLVISTTVLLALLAWRAAAWRLLGVRTSADEPAPG